MTQWPLWERWWERTGLTRAGGGDRQGLGRVNDTGPDWTVKHAEGKTRGEKNPRSADKPAEETTGAGGGVWCEGSGLILVVSPLHCHFWSGTSSSWCPAGVPGKVSTSDYLFFPSLHAAALKGQSSEFNPHDQLFGLNSSWRAAEMNTSPPIIGVKCASVCPGEILGVVILI